MPHLILRLIFSLPVRMYRKSYCIPSAFSFSAALVAALAFYVTVLVSDELSSTGLLESPMSS